MTILLPDDLVLGQMSKCFGHVDPTSSACQRCALVTNCGLEQIQLILAAEVKRRGVFTQQLVPAGTLCPSCGERITKTQKVQWRPGELVCQSCWERNPRE